MFKQSVYWRSVMSQQLVRRELEVVDLVRVRASTDGREAYVAWAGALYSMVPGESQRHLFNIVGMNVGRCLDNQDGSWSLVSREVTYYTDIQTGEILRTWHNPWTDELLPVVHVANNPVQIYLKGKLPATVANHVTTFSFDVFLDYPNPLAGDARFLEYSPDSHYKAAEFLKLTVPTEALLQPETPFIANVAFSWNRLGPWLPWMKMGTRAGQLVYSACGSRVEGFAALPQVLQDEISARLPLYRHAPRLKLSQRNMTSWVYFKRHFKAYLRGDIFPVPELVSA